MNVERYGFLTYFALTILFAFLGAIGLPVFTYEIITACGLKTSLFTMVSIVVVSRTITTLVTFAIARYLAKDYFGAQKDNYPMIVGLSKALERH